MVSPDASGACLGIACNCIRVGFVPLHINEPKYPFLLTAALIMVLLCNMDMTCAYLRVVLITTPTGPLSEITAIPSDTPEFAPTFIVM